MDQDRQFQRGIQKSAVLIIIGKPLIRALSADRAITEVLVAGVPFLDPETADLAVFFSF